MIKKRVVFLLGAGASFGYGYPSGAELMAALTGNQGDYLRFFDLEGIPQDRVFEFQNRLRRSGLSSVDAFLQRNANSADIAKIRIAQELAARERAVLEGRIAQRAWGPETWYGYLFSNLLDTGAIDNFAPNDWSFITLNYDRSLEFDLTTMLSNAYEGTNWDACARLVAERLNIVHLHGYLGPLPGFAPDGLRYGMIGDDYSIREAANRNTHERPTPSRAHI
jgi:hypothetical protein